MPNEYKSMREIGKHFGGTSHEVGKWLQNLGLRDENKNPTQRAYDEEWIAKLPSTQPGTWFYGWHEQRTVELFRTMGYVGKRGLPSTPE